MADIYDADTIGLELADIGEKPVDFGIGQCGGWFIQDKHPTILGQGTSDFDELLLADTETGSGRSRIEFAEANPGERAARSVVQLPKADESRSLGQAAQENVFGDAQRANDVELLKDHDNTGMLGFAFGARRMRQAGKTNFASIGSREPAKDARERRFARAIAADERMDLASVEFETEVGQDGNAVTFLQAGDEQEWSVVRHSKRE
jgi:hypothetical protein